MTDTRKSSIHAGHRARIRERFRQEGLTGFSEHEVLELLLTYAIPQRDVNPLAHELINRFGSLAGVLEADEQELLRVSGVGANAASILTLIPPLLAYYQMNALGARPVIQNLAEARAYCHALFMGAHRERVYMLCMDQVGHVLHPALLHEGTLDEVKLYPREIVQTALRYNAYGVILTHNHPGGIAVPSHADYVTTKSIVVALATVQVRVVDHIIVAGASSFSINRACQHGDGLGKDLSYLIRSSVVSGTRGSLRAQPGGEWISLTFDDTEDQP